MSGKSQGKAWTPGDELAVSCSVPRLGLERVGKSEHES
jgi:hypothetical protein